MKLLHDAYDLAAGSALEWAASRGVNAEFRLPFTPTPAMVRRVVEHSKKTPYFDLDGYMKRDFNHQGERLVSRTHTILRSDLDRDLHNHPWHYATLILDGGYWEVTPLDFDQPNHLDQEDRYRVRTWYGPGTLLVRCHPRFRHRLEVPEGTSTTTFFSYLPKHRDWGFFAPQGTVYWEHWDYYKDLPPEQAFSLTWDHPVMIGPDGWAYDRDFLKQAA